MKKNKRFKQNPILRWIRRRKFEKQKRENEKIMFFKNTEEIPMLRSHSNTPECPVSNREFTIGFITIIIVFIITLYIIDPLIN